MAGNLCNGSPAADSVPALMAAGAKVKVAGKDGSRIVPIEQIPVGPGKTSLVKGELIEAILLSKRPAMASDAYLRFIPRSEMDIAVVSVGVNLALDRHGVVVEARVALGAVAPTVILVEDAATMVVGSKLEETALEKLAAACSAACRPIDDKRGTVEFRTSVAGVLARRAAKIAYKRAGAK
jgi:carbon-monoxide dehydrogenase medium subunit